MGHYLMSHWYFNVTYVTINTTYCTFVMDETTKFISHMYQVMSNGFL